MANNETVLFEVQVGTQVDFDTAIAPTEKLMGIEEANFTPVSESEAIAELRGTLVPAYNVTYNKRGGGAKLSGTATYEQLPWFLDSLLGKATASGTSPYVRTWKGLVEKPTPRFLTLVKRSDSGTYRLVGGIVNGMTLSQEANMPLKLGDVDVIGKIVEPTTSAAMADSVVNIPHANHATIYIDPDTGTYGTTLVAGATFSWELGLNANRTVRYGIGSDSPVGWHHAGRAEGGSNALKLAIEFDAQSKAWLDEILTATRKYKVQITYQLDANNILTVKYFGFVANAPEMFSDSDGVAQVEFEMNPLYDSGLGSWMTIELTNTVADF